MTGGLIGSIKTPSVPPFVLVKKEEFLTEKDENSFENVNEVKYGCSSFSFSFVFAFAMISFVFFKRIRKGKNKH